jgi:hypothetical protein
VGTRRGWVGAPMLCLCTTPGQDGLAARLLVVQGERGDGTRRSALVDSRMRASSCLVTTKASSHRFAASVTEVGTDAPAWPHPASSSRTALNTTGESESARVEAPRLLPPSAQRPVASSDGSRSQREPMGASRMRAQACRGVTEHHQRIDSYLWIAIVIN